MLSLGSWIEVMYDGMDVTSVDLQPVRDHSAAVCAFFIVIFVVGSFLVMNLFVVITIDKYLEMKERMEGLSVFNVYSGHDFEVASLILLVKPARGFTGGMRQQGDLGDSVRVLIYHPWFDTFFMALVMGHTCAMALEHVDMAAGWAQGLQVVSFVFTAIFGMEVCLRMAACGPRGRDVCGRSTPHAS